MTASVTHLGLRIMLVLLVIGCGVASARWKPEFADNSPAVQKWFQEQTNSVGQSCCKEADGHPYYGDYTLNQDGSVTAENIDIPKEKVVTGANPTGSAIWFYLGSGPTRTTFCFVPGPLT